MLVMRRRRKSDHDAEMTITMPVTPERPSLVTKVPSFLQTTKQRIPDLPAKNISPRAIIIFHRNSCKGASETRLTLIVSKQLCNDFFCQQVPDTALLAKNPDIVLNTKSHFSLTIFLTKVFRSSRIMFHSEPIAMCLLSKKPVTMYKVV